MTLTFTLNSSTLNTGAGPFDIYCKLSGQSVFNLLTNGVETATGITKEQMIQGYTISDVPDTIIQGYVKSTGMCSTQSEWWIEGVIPTYETRTVIGFSPIDELHAVNSVQSMDAFMVYVKIDNGLIYTDEELSILINGWYIWYGDDPSSARHFIDGIEEY